MKIAIILQMLIQGSGDPDVPVLNLTGATGCIVATL